MGSETSEQVMALLKELAMLKELDESYEANPTEVIMTRIGCANSAMRKSLLKSNRWRRRARQPNSMSPYIPE